MVQGVKDSTRRTVRTAFAGTVSAVALFPLIVQTSGVDADAVPYLATGVAVCTAVTRVMALPGVNAWLQLYVPWLAAQPRPVADGQGADGAGVERFHQG